MTLQIKNLSKTYKSYGIQSLNLMLYPGEIFGLIGNNNSNKQVFLQLLSGLKHPDEGEIRCFNQVLNYKKMSDIGFSLPSVYFYENFTGYENIKYYLKFYKSKIKLNKRQVKDRINHYFRLFSLEKHMHSKVTDYSLGMKQKLKLIRALIINPKIIILDEPYKHLDPISINILNTELKLRAQEGAIIFISSSVLDHMNALASRIGLLYQGILIEDLSIEALKSQQQNFIEIQTDMLSRLLMVLEHHYNIFDYEVIDDYRVYIYQETSIDFITEIYKHDIDIYSLKYGFSSLEDYFLERTDQL